MALGVPILKHIRVNTSRISIQYNIFERNNHSYNIHFIKVGYWGTSIMQKSFVET